MSKIGRFRLFAICVSGALAAGAASAAPKAGKGDAGKGKAVFEQCAVCHNADSTDKKMGPGLKGIFKRAKLASGKPVNESNIRATIDAGGNGMPPYKEMLSDQEKDNLIAYLKTL